MTGIIESGLFRSERYQLEERTDDPASTSEGEMWIRVDLAPEAEQLATLRVDAGSEVWDVPIYDVGATTENVSKAWRVQIGGSTGFVPITDAQAAYSALRYQHDSAAFEAHDALEASVIPDGALYYEGGLEEDWVEGWKTSSEVVTSKNSDHLYIYVDTDGDDGGTWVTDNTIDLSGYSEIEVNWQNEGQSADQWSTLAVDTDKDGDYSNYNERIRIEGSFSRRTDTLDISDRSVNYYVRIHADDFGSGYRTSELSVYSVVLVE